MDKTLREQEREANRAIRAHREAAPERESRKSLLRGRRVESLAVFLLARRNPHGEGRVEWFRGSQSEVRRQAVSPSGIPGGAGVIFEMVLQPTIVRGVHAL